MPLPKWNVERAPEWNVHEIRQLEFAEKQKQTSEMYRLLLLRVPIASAFPLSAFPSRCEPGLGGYRTQNFVIVCVIVCVKT